MIILKFGGTSVNTKERVTAVCTIVKKLQAKKPIVVVSAIRGVTDLLLSAIGANKNEQVKIVKKIFSIHLQLANDFFGFVPEDFEAILSNIENELFILFSLNRKSKMFQDKIVSYGEILSAHFINLALMNKNLSTTFVDATTCIITNSLFGQADFIADKTEEKIENIILPLLSKNVIPVITGFIGAAENGQTTTLGRGGSDYSASIIGYCLGAEEIQFWKDVDGIYSADPKIEKDAQLFKNLSYQETSSLLEQGSKVLHPRSILPASSLRIPIKIMNTLRPDSSGTLISYERKKL